MITSHALFSRSHLLRLLFTLCSSLGYRVDELTYNENNAARGQRLRTMQGSLNSTETHAIIYHLTHFASMQMQHFIYWGPLRRREGTRGETVPGTKISYLLLSRSGNAYVAAVAASGNSRLSDARVINRRQRLHWFFGIFILNFSFRFRLSSIYCPS